MEIQHVSDTALMVAAARALESARDGAIICDPYAHLLAGERGMSLATARGQEWMRIGISIRTHFIDEMLHAAIAERGIETVVNLGAGLDTRPWRMDLPSTLRWIEVDFQPILEYKRNALAGERPKCSRETVYADLANPADRDRVYAVVGGGPALMVTEGLLMYLPADTVDALAREAPLRTGIREWLFDIASADLMRAAHNQGLDQIEKVRAKDHLTGSEITDAARRAGWRLVRHMSYARDSGPLVQRILGRLPQVSPEMANPPSDDPSGVYLFAR